MFAAQFIFTPGIYDEEFHTLDSAIEDFVATVDGYLGVEKWRNADGTTLNHIYYFEHKEALTAFSRFPRHLEAKGKVHQWYDGYQVIISEVAAAYGDGNITSLASGVKGKKSFYEG